MIMNISDEMLNLMNQVKVATSPLRDFSSSDLETIYISAYQFYQNGSYARSCELFLQLISSNPYEGNFWKGLASCYQMQSAFEQALHAWAMLALLSPKTLWPTPRAGGVLTCHEGLCRDKKSHS
jgi:tetratricopeptide (TPR) repeat protein